jgi:Flp pilus assembly protein TadD
VTVELYPELVMNSPDSSKADICTQLGLELLAAGTPVEAVREFRAAIAEDENHVVAHHGLVRALRDAGRLEDAIGAALRLTVITPHDPLAHAALSISLQAAGHVPEAEAAAAKARVLEWKVALQSPPEEDRSL